MAATKEKKISDVQAAGLIYGTTQPGPVQVANVRELMRCGVLKSYSEKKFITTKAEVARYISTRQIKRQMAEQAKRSHSQHGEEAATGTMKPIIPSQATVRHSREVRKLLAMYRDVTTDYLLSVFSIGGTEGRAQLDHRRTVSFRIGSLLALVIAVACVFGTQRHFAKEVLPEKQWAEEGVQRLLKNNDPARPTVEEWIRQNRHEGKLLDLLPAQPRPGGKAIRARFRSNAKGQQGAFEDLVFVVYRETVIRTESPDATDTALLEVSPDANRVAAMQAEDIKVVVKPNRVVRGASTQDDGLPELRGPDGEIIDLPTPAKDARHGNARTPTKSRDTAKPGPALPGIPPFQSENF